MDQRAFEERTAREGSYVASRKPATVYRVLEVEDEIGAAEGGPSRWIYVESTNGVYHGRPITREKYDRLMKGRVECCDERSQRAEGAP